MEEVWSIQALYPLENLRVSLCIQSMVPFFSFSIYSLVGTSLVGLSSWYSNLNKGAGSGERIFELLEKSPVIENKGTLFFAGKTVIFRFCDSGKD